MGLLYVEQRAGATMPADRDLHVLAETIALSLVNLRLRETLRNQSIRDPLTGLFNRRYLEESLELECERAKRSGQSVGVLMLDVDHFKLFNDSFGHEAGDMILKHLGDVLKTSIRKGDVACRYGGEEFTVVLPGASLDESAQVAEKIRGAAHAVESVLRGASLGKITISVGVAIYPGSGDTPAETIDAADQALYTAKRLGRDRVELYVPRHQALAAI